MTNAQNDDCYMNSGRWDVVDADGKIVETYYSPKAANRACMILSAHELKNGRTANYRIKPPIDLRPIEELGLPPWAFHELRKYGL